MQIHLGQWVCAGALGSDCRDFIARLYFKFSDLFLWIKSSIIVKQMEYFNRIKHIRILLYRNHPLLCHWSSR